MTTGFALGIALCFLQGFLFCGFLATFDYAPEANAARSENSFSAHLNGKATSLPLNYSGELTVVHHQHFALEFFCLPL